MRIFVEDSAIDITATGITATAPLYRQRIGNEEQANCASGRATLELYSGRASTPGNRASTPGHRA
ncbi:MAG TPA: hypothetical protein V6C65_27160 [Allocoleopsis sp.]